MARTDYARRRALADALVSGLDKTSAAKVSGYSRAQVYVVLKDPSFKQLLEQRAQAERASGRVQPEDVDAAVSYLRRVVDGEVEGERERTTAAKTLIQYGTVSRVAARAKTVSEPAKATPQVAPEVTASDAAGRWRVVG